MLFTGTIRAMSERMPRLTVGQSCDLRLNGIAISVEIESQDKDDAAVRGEIAETLGQHDVTPTENTHEMPVIQQLNAQRHRAVEQAAKRVRQEEEAAILVKQEGAEAWQTFIGALTLNAETLSQMDGEQFSGNTPQFWYFWIGTLLVAVVMFLPNGILGGLAKLASSWRGKS